MTAPSSATAVRAEGVDAPDLRIFVFGLFFVFGGITSLNDILIPKLRELFTLTYAQAMLVQSAFFAAYFLVSLPAAAAVRRLGYSGPPCSRAHHGSGMPAFVPASARHLGVFLFALFIRLRASHRAGRRQSAVSLLGPVRTAHSRLLSRSVQFMGTTIFPTWGPSSFGLAATVTAASSLAPARSLPARETRS